MDVGQVKFSIIADGLDDTLTKAGQLQGILNGMDGKTYRAGATKRANAETAYNRAVQRSLRNHKQLMNQTQRQADMYHKQSEKRIRDALKFSKINARNQAYAQKLEEEQYKQREKYQQRWETTLARHGARLQTLGATIQNITEPFTNVYRGLAMGVGYKLLGTVQNSIEGAMSRFDTRNLYKKMMKEYSNANYSTAQSWNELDQSVIGLPTSVAEIAEMAQRYTLSLGNMERGTRLAIASNRAFLASMATDTQKYQGMLQLQDLMNGKELQPREWMSLGASMGKAINEIAKVMGAKTQEDIRKFRQELYAGKVNTEDFLDALEKVGNKGGKIYKMAEEYKDTIEALRKNVGNAFQRMGEHLLMALDDIFQSATGKGLVQNLLGITKAIDDMSESAQEWIKSNPDVIMDFFNDLKSIDWKGMISGFAQFGLTMGKIYTGLLKTFGGKGLIYAMLYGNLAGKGIQLAGGLEKGLAGPISKMFTLFKFGAGGKVIKGAKDLAKNHGVLVRASETVRGMALSWQDVASKAISVAAIPALAGSLVLVAKALQEFEKVKVDWVGLTAKLGMAGEAIGAFGIIAGGIGALITASGPAGWITTGLVGTGVAAVGGISAVMIAAAKGLSDISKAEIPSPEKVAEVTDAIYQIGKKFKSKDPITALGTIFDSWTKRSEIKTVQNAAAALSSIADSLNIKLPSGWKKKASKRLGKLMGLAKDLEEIMMGEDEELMGKSKGIQAFSKGSRSKTAEETFTARKQRLKEFADYAKSFAQGMGDIVSSLTSISSFDKVWAKMPKDNHGTVDFGSINGRITGLIDSFYELALPGEDGSSPLQKLRQAAEQVKGANYGKLTEALGELPKVIGKLASIQQQFTNNAGMFQRVDLHNSMGVQKSPVESLAEQLQPMFGAIQQISNNVPEVGGLKRLGKIKKHLAKVPQIISQLKAISTNSDVGGISTTAIHDAVAKIQEALNELESLNDKNVDLKITINGTVKNKAKKELDSAYKKTKAAIDKFDKLPKSKTVSVNLVPNITGVGAVEQAVNSAVASVAAAVSRLGGAFSSTVNGSVPYHPRQMGGTIYRAGGGNISRGTDIVPAMLTPGEFVLKQRAASMLGHTLLNRLNHLDIRGAISELSARASQRSSMVSTVNNTKNISLTMNNNNSSSIGLSRTSGWLNRL